MKPIEFPEQTIVIAKDQPEYQPLPAYHHKDEYGTITCCWQLTWRERMKVLFGGKMWHSILTFNHALQPQRLEVEKPHMPLQWELSHVHGTYE